MQVTTTNSSGEIRKNKISELPENMHTSGYVDFKYNEEELNSPETVEAVETLITKQLEEKTDLPLNRAQRRALMKKTGRKGRAQFGLINDTAKKLDYINLIQKIKELKEKNENEVSNENN